jgi:hypothetical protein
MTQPTAACSRFWLCIAIQQAGGNFILTCKPSSHQTIRKGRQHTTIVYRWLSGVPLRAGADAITVNWFSVEIRNADGKRTYYNSFVTDLDVNADSVAELAACGRARWKIKNETFNVLKTNGYNLEHNFGHGKATLASIFLTFNPLVLAFHTAACGATCSFFENLRTITAYIVFQHRPQLLQAITAADLRPP